MKGLGLYFEMRLSVSVSLRNSTGVGLWPHSELRDCLWIFHGYFEKQKKLRSRWRFLAASEAPTGDGCLSLIALCVWLINQYDGSLLFINVNHAQRDELFIIIPADEKLLSSNWSIKHRLWSILREWRIFALWYHVWFSVFIDQSIDALWVRLHLRWRHSDLSSTFFEFVLRLWIFVIVCCLFPESFKKNSFCFFLCFFCHFASFYNIFLFSTFNLFNFCLLVF